MSEANATVLVVDDLEANRRLLEAILRPRGYEVLAAPSGSAALEALRAAPVDLVLLDVQMPGMNGYEVCRRIREDAAHAMVPVVMVTASGAEERVNAIDAGADDFIVRPLNQAELLGRVRSLLRIKAYHDALQGQAAELAAFNRHLEQSVQEQVEELEQLRRLRRFLSPQLAAAVQSGDADALLEPHRGEVAVLFLDLRGFTAFSAASEPEEVRDALSVFHALLGELVTAHGATVGFFAGDGVMLFFNDPLPCADPVRRAVATASMMLERFAERAARWRSGEHPLGIGAGVSYGYATLGMFGFEGRWDYTAVGPTVIVASRLCDVAKDGEILLSRRAVEGLGDDATVEHRGDLALRGFADPVGVWALSSGGSDRPRTDPVPVATDARASAPRQLELSVLGPLEVRSLGRDVAIPSAKERTLLVVLAVSHGDVVSVERLAEELWDAAPPDSAIASVRVYVSRIRKTLAAAGAEGVLVTKPAGYQLRVDPAAIDAVRFERLADTGMDALQAGDPARAAAALREALGLWRGDALSDAATGPAARGHAARLEERRLMALEDLLDAELELGHHRQVITELEPLLHAHPLRERFWAQRMVALYRSGRQPESLRAFQEVRTLLIHDLGLEPSPELVALERAVATGSVPEPSASAPSP